MGAEVRSLDHERRFLMGRKALAEADKSGEHAATKFREAAELAYGLNPIYTQAQIAEGFGCTQQRISLLLKWKRGGFQGTYTEISHASRKHTSPACKVPDPEIVERDNQIIARAKAGESSTEIATDLNIGSRRVRAIIRDAGLPASPPKTLDPGFEARVSAEVERRIAIALPHFKEKEAQAEETIRARIEGPLTRQEYKIIERAITSPEAHSRELALEILRSKRWELVYTKGNI